jgi:putative ABC transport system permease protein
MILRKGLVLTVCGIVVGVFLSLGLGKVLLASIGTGGSPKDGAPFMFSEPSAAAFLVSVLVVTMLAAYIPARRASKVDPNVALKYE